MQPHADFEVLHHGAPASSQGVGAHEPFEREQKNSRKYSPGTVSCAGIKQLSASHSQKDLATPSVNQFCYANSESEIRSSLQALGLLELEQLRQRKHERDERMRPIAPLHGTLFAAGSPCTPWQNVGTGSSEGPPGKDIAGGIFWPGTRAGAHPQSSGPADCCRHHLHGRQEQQRFERRFCLSAAPACVHIRDLRGQGLASCEGPNQPAKSDAGSYDSLTAEPNGSFKCAPLQAIGHALPHGVEEVRQKILPWQQLQKAGTALRLSSGRPLQVCRKVTAES